MAKKITIFFVIVFFLGLALLLAVRIPARSKVILENKQDAKVEKFCLVNINIAGETELDTLPSIGPAAAKRIITYREQFGKFKTVEELKNVKGIGKKTFEKLKERISAE